MDRLKHYLALVEGLLAFRAVPPAGLSQETEAELSEVQDDLWRRMTDAEREAAEDVLINLKSKWDRLLSL